MTQRRLHPRQRHPERPPEWFDKAMAVLNRKLDKMSQQDDNLEAAEAGLETAVSGNTAELTKLVAELASTVTPGADPRVDAVIVKMQAAAAKITSDDTGAETQPAT